MFFLDMPLRFTVDSLSWGEHTATLPAPLFPTRQTTMAVTCDNTMERSVPSYADFIASGAKCNHHVQLYESEEHLFKIVSSFIVPAIKSDDAVVIIAGKRRIEALEVCFREQSVSTERIKHQHQLVFVDAEMLADTVLSDGSTFESEKVEQFLVELFTRVQKNYRRVFVYGELVNILCERGNHTGALELEQLWSRFVLGRDITLLCGYDMNNFKDGGLNNIFDRICHQHTQIKPAETYTSLETQEQKNLMVASLQQRAKALENEVIHHRATKTTLQGALSLLSARTSETVGRERDGYLTLLSMLPVGVCGTTAREGSREYFINQRFCEISGLSEASIRDGGWINAIHHADRDQVTTSLRAVKRGDDEFARCEYRFVHPDNTIRWVAGEAVANSCGYVQTVVDITEFKMLENERLDAMRAAEEHQRMRAAEAEKHRQHREQFVDSLCHELRNPLGGIFGNVELLKMGLETRRSVLEKSFITQEDLNLLREQLLLDEESLDAISTCAVHQQTVTDDVLNLSKLELGKVVLKKVNFDPKITISSVMKMFEVQAQRKGIELRACLPVADTIIAADPHRLSQIIINLIANALKFTEQGSITLQFDTVERGPESTLFRITVQDTGVGLTKDEKAVLFDRFSQPSSTNYSEYGGTGLGLHISKGLVELMGGVIFVESRKGQGSKFTFTFRCEEDRGGSSFNLSRSSPKSYKDSISISASAQTEAIIPSIIPRPINHILIVEDNHINQRLITRLLASESFICTVASNGQEALDLLEKLSTSESPINLILMDIQMPVMGGIPATLEIRRREKLTSTPFTSCSRIPIIGLSGNVRENHVLNALESGMDDYLIKPVRKIDILTAIQRFGNDMGERTPPNGTRRAR